MLSMAATKPMSITPVTAANHHCTGAVINLRNSSFEANFRFPLSNRPMVISGSQCGARPWIQFVRMNRRHYCSLTVLSPAQVVPRRIYLQGATSNSSNGTPRQVFQAAPTKCSTFPPRTYSLGHFSRPENFPLHPGHFTRLFKRKFENRH